VRQRQTWLVLTAVTAAVAVLGVIGAQALRARAGDAPLWQRSSYRDPSSDRAFKCDLVEQQDLEPQVVIFGGSRSMRMPPAVIEQQTGLPAFNAGFHNGRPTDSWAFYNFLLERAPDDPPGIVWCVQVSAFNPIDLHESVVLDERLSRFFPVELIEARRAYALDQEVFDLLDERRFASDGLMLRNRYDARVEDGVPLSRVLDEYLDAELLADVGDGRVPEHSLQMAYFEKALALANDRGVRPLIVIMPFQPRVDRTIRAEGWGIKERWLDRYLLELGSSYRFSVVDGRRIETWGGRAEDFFDGTHLTPANSVRLMRYCIEQAPECFERH
jgi:hypothetical protein